MLPKQTSMLFRRFFFALLFIIAHTNAAFGQPGAHEPQIGGMLGQNGFVSIINSQDWPWGERYYEDEFDINLLVTNNCDTPEPIYLRVTGLPYLSMPTQALIPARTTNHPVTGKVKLPPAPPPPLRTGAPDEPGYGWVEPAPIPPQPFSLNPIPPFHQPNFGPISGSVLVTHPASRQRDVECMAHQKSYQASGHIHFRPPEPAPQSQLFSADVCLVYWNLGEPPAQLGATDCTQKMRRYADDFLKRVVGPYAANDPESWAWLSMVSDLNSMSIPQLLAFKEQASLVMGGGELGTSSGITSQARTEMPGFSAVLSGGDEGVKVAGAPSADQQRISSAQAPVPMAEKQAKKPSCEDVWSDNNLGENDKVATDKVCLKQMQEAARVVRDQVVQSPKTPAALLPSNSKLKKMNAVALTQYRQDAAAYAKASAIEKQLDTETKTTELERAARSPCDNLWHAPNRADAPSLAACEPSFREQAAQTSGLWRAAALERPKEWQWLPSEKVLNQMSGAQLFSVKQKADSQLNKGSW